MQWLIDKLHVWFKNRNIYKIDDDSSVEIYNSMREVYFIYREGPKIMRIYGGEVNYSASMLLKDVTKWLPPHDKEEVDNIKRGEIFRRVESTLKRNKIRVNEY